MLNPVIKIQTIYLSFINGVFCTSHVVGVQEDIQKTVCARKRYIGILQREVAKKKCHS